MRFFISPQDLPHMPPTDRERQNKARYKRDLERVGDMLISQQKEERSKTHCSVRYTEPTRREYVTPKKQIIAEDMREAHRTMHIILWGVLAFAAAILIWALLPQRAHAETMGERNCNLINLKASGIHWRGMTGVDKFGHAIFATFSDGKRAALLNLNNHKRKYPRQTLRQYMRVFKTKRGDYQAVYIARALRVSPDIQLRNLDMAAVLVPLARIETRMIITVPGIPGK